MSRIIKNFKIQTNKDNSPSAYINRFFRDSLALPIILIGLISCNIGKQKEPIQYFNAGANIWQLEFAGSDQLVMADYKGRISLKMKPYSESIWTYPAKAFVFDLKTADINQDGLLETAFVTAQGELVVLDEKGHKKWSFKSLLPLYNVGIGNFTGDEQLEVACGGIDRHVYIFDASGNQIAKSSEMKQLVHRMAIGDLQGDSHDEILVIENRNTANLLCFANDSLFSVWQKPLKVPDKLINWENPRGSFFPFSIEIDDLDEDGTNEIIMGDTYFNKQAVMVANNQAEPLWISEGLPPFKNEDDAQLEFYSTAFVRSADIFKNNPGKEVISVAGGMFRIWDKEGNLLGEQNTRLGFTDFEISENDMYLGSCPNGDEFIYNINIDTNWETDVASMEFQGLIKDIKNNTARLKKQVEVFQPGQISDKKYDIINGFGSMPASEKALREYHEQQNWFKQKFPYPNLQVIKSMKIIEEDPPLDNEGKPWSPGRWKVDAINGTMSLDEILNKAKWIEENQIPTLFYIGHSCMPFISMETAEKILQLAPKYCIGFQTAEDENIQAVPQYFEYFFKPLANLCLKYNKVCITKNKGLWWMSSPAHAEVFEAMFEGGRDKVSMAATEDSNSRTPEINLMARGGLWQAGLLHHNDVSIHADLFSFNRFHQWEYPRAGNPYLRLLLAHTTLGMTQISSRIREISPGLGSDGFSTIGQESTEIFYHMLGKGLVFSPDRQDVLGYSPIGMVVHKPDKKWLLDAHNGHSPQSWVDDSELNNALFPHNGSLWGMTNTPDQAFQKVVFNKERQFGYQIPPTPFGLVAFVPEYTDLSKVANIKDWWHTDGIYAWREGGPKLTGMEAAEALKSDFEKAASQLPFRMTSEPVFMQILRIAENHYRLFLVDPGWINPKNHEVLVKIQLQGNFTVKNVLEKEIYPVDQKRRDFQVKVPAGLFSIVDITKVNN